MSLIEQFSAYTQWRGDLSAALQQLRSWLSENEIGDAQADLRLQYTLSRLKEDKLTVAFVAEFSRGKSELINAIFFSNYGSRVLPSSAGRTTMCPTELMWEPHLQPAIRFLPIETRESDASVAELRTQREAWIEEPIDINVTASMQNAFARVGETILVTREHAEQLGFSVDDNGIKGAKPDANGMVEVARWRHAIVQFPHPLLEQGLVIIDTPGLNAIGSEPELTLSLLPNAHATLFILATDTGVTQSDLAVWQEHVNIGRAQQRGRLVVLNKIDSLWDGIRTDWQIDNEIQSQVTSVSNTLGIPPNQIYPLSAQKALLAKLENNFDLLNRSRIQNLEYAMSNELLPTRQDILRENAHTEASEIVLRAYELLEARRHGLQEQLHEIDDLRGKNQSVIEYMMRKVRMEKEEFEQGLRKYQAVRSIFTQLTNKLFTHIGLDTLRHETHRTRTAMLDANFSRGLREAMTNFFGSMRGNLHKSSEEIGEITVMLDAMYKRFSVEHGLKLAAPENFSTRRYEKEIDRLEEAFNDQFSSVGALLTQWKGKVTQRFFETIAVEARRTFEGVNRDVEQWLRAIMAPLETQVREYQLQLKRRLESVKRIHQATDTLDERVSELRFAENALLRQIDELHGLRTRLENSLNMQIGSGGFVSMQPMAA